MKLITASTDGKLKTWNTKDNKLIFTHYVYSTINKMSTNSSAGKFNCNSELILNKGNKAYMYDLAKDNIRPYIYNT
jgi:hypothetical protein